MAYRVELTRAAVRQLAALPRSARRRIQAAVELLSGKPRPPNCKRLKGRLHEFHRVRTGDYRIVYLIVDDRLVVCVITIAHRKDVYR
ncbi:MAG TPA: type II toxin-antitoxin system RelE/ParE family toxin [Phycisphaerae bacterium]|nr:type II toxin-antitoxin system RelE/ParE family toxin [Phycisphaerae bacterium]HUT56770.1 type II toxin-antitoxin system RelE/ParE family toxin [Phycisphaerae bacterium]